MNKSEHKLQQLKSRKYVFPEKLID